MVWWVWVIIVVAVLVAVLGFLEWRSWRKPLPPGLDGQHYTPGSGLGAETAAALGASHRG